MVKNLWDMKNRSRNLGDSKGQVVILGSVESVPEASNLVDEISTVDTEVA